MSNIDLKGGAKATGFAISESAKDAIKDSAVEQSGKAIIELLAQAFEKTQPEFAVALRTPFGQEAALGVLAVLLHVGSTSGLVPFGPAFVQEVTERTMSNTIRNATNTFGEAGRTIAFGAFAELSSLEDTLAKVGLKKDTNVVLSTESAEEEEVSLIESNAAVTAKG